MKPTARLFALALFLPVAAFPATLSYFFDINYVDTDREAVDLRTSLLSLGQDPADFSGSTTAAWTAATTGVPALVIPELESGDLDSALEPGAKTALATFVREGGCLLVSGTGAVEPPNDIRLLNDVFGFLIAAGADFSGNSITSLLDPTAAAGTPFAPGPATLPFSNRTVSYEVGSLPGGSKAIYVDNVGMASFSSVASMPFGAGRIEFLGFDWFERPTPNEWFTVLGEALQDCGIELGTLEIPTLDLSGLAALAGFLALSALALLHRR